MESRVECPSIARLLAAVLIVLVSLGLLAARADAVYVEAGSFAGTGPGPGGSGAEDGQLSNPGQADVNDATGNLYVADTGNNRIEVFKPTATAVEYVSQVAVTAPTGLAIDESDGSVYVATASGVAKYDEALNPIVGPGWTDPGVIGALAVDPATGDLLVADTAANLVRRFKSDGTAAGSFSAQRPIDLAANSTGEIFVVTTTGDIGAYPCGSSSAVERFDGAGVAEGTLHGATVPGAVAVDPDDDSIVVATHVNEYFCEKGKRPGVAFYDAGGALAEEVTLAPDAFFAAVPALVASGGSSRVYAITKSPANDTFGATRGTVLEIPPPTAPQILGASALRGREDATLQAQVNPGGLATAVHIEYGATSSYGNATPVETSPADFSPFAVSTSISGLAPGATYHYRVVAVNSLGTVEGVDRTFATEGAGAACPNEAFRTGAAAYLSDCRAYELVTPTDSDADIRIGGGPATADGEMVCFASEDPLAGSDSNGIKTTDDGFCAHRGADGWATEWVTGPPPPKRVASMGSEVYFLSPDGRRAVFASDAAILGKERVPPPGTPSGSSVSAYMWDDGVTEWLAPAGPPVGEPPEYRSEFASRPLEWDEAGSAADRRPLAVSEDLTHGVFESGLPILPEDENDLVDVYEWTPEGLRIVSRDSTGKAAGGRTGIQVFGMAAPPGAVSADGERVFFQHDGAPLVGTVAEAPEGPDPEAEYGEPGLQSVYVREGDRLTLISPRRGSGPNQSVWFAGASSDGTIAYLETSQQLTAAAKESGRAIYSYDVATDELQLVADAPGGVKFLALSDDGSTIVYREEASHRLAVERDGVGTTLGTLAASDYEREQGVATNRIDQRMLRVTSDGRVVVFAAAGEFAGFGPGAVQIYRWDAADGLQRISAEPNFTPTANASIGAYPALTGNPREELFLAHRARANVGRVMSDDGSRVFFETPEALVNRDVNGVTDVYEWHDGTIRLVSTGTGGKALYHESSADGKTVFFTTFNRVLPDWDRNSKRDLYVARPDGGLPPPPGPPDCTGENCQSPRQAPPADSPGSTAGEGNAASGRAVAIPTRLRRGQLKRLAHGGVVRLQVRVTVPGRVKAVLQAKLGGRARIVDTTTRVVTKPGTVGLPLRLSPRAMKQLKDRGKLRSTLVVSHSGSTVTVKREVKLHD